MAEYWESAEVDCSTSSACLVATSTATVSVVLIVLGPHAISCIGWVGPERCRVQARFRWSHSTSPHAWQGKLGRAGSALEPARPDRVGQPDAYRAPVQAVLGERVFVETVERLKGLTAHRRQRSEDHDM